MKAFEQANKIVSEQMKMLDPIFDELYRNEVTMKDNQMKQAEFEEFRKYFNTTFIDKNATHLEVAYEFFNRGKLTTSQVSEPVGELCMDSQGFGAYKQIKTLPYGYHKLYTTPQEAISPAVAEVFVITETNYWKCKDGRTSVIGVSDNLNKAMQYLDEINTDSDYFKKDWVISDGYAYRKVDYDGAYVKYEVRKSIKCEASKPTGLE